MQVLLIVSKKMRHTCRHTSETTLPFGRSSVSLLRIRTIYGVRR
jgi:hypothetical protein